MGFSIWEALNQGHRCVFNAKERLQSELLRYDRDDEVNRQSFERFLKAVRESADSHKEAVPARKRAFEQMQDAMKRQKEKGEKANTKTGKAMDDARSVGFGL